MTPSLSAAHLTLGYQKKIVVDNLSLTLPEGKFTVIVGPNGCGKSTLLRALCRLLKPQSGCVLLDGKDIVEIPTKALARQIGLLPQQTIAPEGITVVDLVSRGRYPHQTLLRRWSETDQLVVTQAMTVTGVDAFADRRVDELSGGQRQRVWIAMVLAQQTPMLFLDEPTTWLDIAHQIELLDLFRQLNQQQGCTLVAVLHDLNQACRYADHLIVMKEGRMITEGSPAEIVDSKLIEEVFNLPCQIIDDPVSHTPLVIPYSRSLGGDKSQTQEKPS